MNITHKKTYVYKMKLVPANILCIVIFIVCGIISYFLGVNMISKNMNFLLLFVLMIFYFLLHEFMHGLGYFIGGVKRKNITYGIELEKGIFYAMAYEKLSKRSIIISLLMPFTIIGVITYIVGAIFNIPTLVLLSVINICGASMDLAMAIYILKLPKDFIYSESGNPDEFVIISSGDLTKKKSLFLEIKEVKDYNEKDFEFKNLKKLSITKFSIIFLIIFILIGLVSTIVK